MSSSQWLYQIVHQILPLAHRISCMACDTFERLLDSRSTQSPRLATPRATELQSRRISNLRDRGPQLSALSAQQSFGDSFSSNTKASQNNLQCLDLLQKATLVDLTQHICRQLICSIIGASRSLPKADIASRLAQYGIMLRVREVDMGIMFGRIYM